MAEERCERPCPPAAQSSACSSVRPSAFGLWVDGEQFGEQLAPLAALVNHSCAPNVAIERNGRSIQLLALEGLRAGDELALSYISLRLCQRERAELLAKVWAFTCGCDRCSGQLPSRSWAAFEQRFVCECGAAVLDAGKPCKCTQSVSWVQDT